MSQILDFRTLKNELDTKISLNNVATQNSNGVMSTNDKKKLDGIAAGANNYSHPTSHSASMITETSDRVFMTPTEKTKLTGIDAGANNYSHPTSHSASMITETSDRVFMTPTEKTKLSGIANNANNYSHPTNDGNKHVPANGTNNQGKFLMATNVAGNYVWEEINTKIIDEYNNYFYGRTIGQALTSMFMLINNIKNKIYYNDLIYSFSQPKILNADKKEYMDTGVKLFNNDENDFTVLFSFSNGRLNKTSGNDTHTLLHCMDEANLDGISLAMSDGTLEFDYNRSSTRGSSKIFADIKCNDEKGHTVVLCKDAYKIRIYLDSVDNYYDIYPQHQTSKMYKNLLVGCYQAANGEKGRHWNGTVFDLKVWDECLSEYNVGILIENKGGE